MKKRVSFPLLCAVLVVAAILFVVMIRSCASQPQQAATASAMQHSHSPAPGALSLPA